MPVIHDLTDQRFGFLLVLGPAGASNGHKLWRWRCDCGKERDFQTNRLTSGSATSCGCAHSGRRRRFMAARNRARSGSASAFAGPYHEDDFRWGFDP